MNLADWPLGVLSHQQPRKADGGKVDYIETYVPRPDGTTQKLTRMAPSAVGLPTPADDDILLGLITLGSRSGFASDKLPFLPRQLLQILGLSDCRDNYDRLEESFTRLRALTLKFEATWYEKATAEVVPFLVTGIVSEARLVRRRGRPASGSTPDSYVVWTPHFYNNLRTGNLLDIDLDFFFSLRRPTAKALYRHLNKRWHSGRKPKTYERDLRDLACGHLGLTDSKDLKRNFLQAVSELHERGYLEIGRAHV